MRRTKGGWMHPASRGNAATSGGEQFAQDSADILRVAERTSLWWYNPAWPPVPLRKAYTFIHQFRLPVDLSLSEFWDEVRSGTGNSAGVVGGAPSYARLQTGTGHRTYIYYQTENECLGWQNGSDLWFEVQIRMETTTGAEAFIGLSDYVAGASGDVFLGSVRQNSIGFSISGGNIYLTTDYTAEGSEVGLYPDVHWLYTDPTDARYQLDNDWNTLGFRCDDEAEGGSMISWYINGQHVLTTQPGSNNLFPQDFSATGGEARSLAPTFGVGTLAAGRKYLDLHWIKAIQADLYDDP